MGTSPALSINRDAGEVEQELREVIDGQSAAIAEVERKNEAVLAELNAMLAERSTALDTERVRHEAVITNLKREHGESSARIQREYENLAGEMETSLVDNEEQRRQLKMKADQASFELSRVRDEHYVQRSNDRRQIGELNKANGALDKIKMELEEVNRELKKALYELQQRFDRTMASMPPQGPPPSTPLPPVPPFMTSPGTPDMMRRGISSSGTPPRTPEKDGSVKENPVWKQQSGASDPTKAAVRFPRSAIHY